MLFTDTGMSKVADNTSAVISFKLPSVLESCGKKQVSCRRNNSSSSSDEADTIPFQTSAHRQRGSMSTQKPSIKSTPDFRSGKFATLDNSQGNKCRFWQIFVEALKEFLDLFIQSKSSRSMCEYSESNHASKYMYMYVMLLATLGTKTAGSGLSQKRNVVINWYLFL